MRGTARGSSAGSTHSARRACAGVAPRLCPRAGAGAGSVWSAADATKPPRGAGRCGAGGGAGERCWAAWVCGARRSSSRRSSGGPGAGSGRRSAKLNVGANVGSSGCGPDVLAVVSLGAYPTLAARGKSPAAFEWRCIPKLPTLGYSLQGSNTAGILPRRALPDGRIATLGATQDFHHGLLEMRPLPSCRPNQ